MKPPRFSKGDIAYHVPSDMGWAGRAKLKIIDFATMCCYDWCNEGEHWVYETDMGEQSENYIFTDETDYILRGKIRGHRS